MAESEDKTLPATERRRQQAREDGQTPLSRELVGASGLAAATLLLTMMGPSLGHTLSRQLQALLSNATASPGAALWAAGLAILSAVLPIAMAVLLAGGAAVLLQTGWLMNTKALMPDLARLDPRRGLKRVFSVNNLADTAKSIAKIGVLSWAVWHVVSGTLATTAATLSWTLGTVIDQLLRDTLHVLMVVLGCQCVIALLDVGWTRYRFSKQLRMSLEEVKQEHKESEGDPRLKAKIKQMRMARARRRMMAAIPKATVVITNPTHFAVALVYERGSKAAPKIVAKGVDEVAARIRAEATKHGVPLVANPPLARTLHKLPLDTEIPADQFKAVAEIIAYVWRLRGMAQTAPQ